MRRAPLALLSCCLLGAALSVSGCGLPDIPLLPTFQSRGYLPEEGTLPGWREVGGVKRFSGSRLSEYIGRQAERYRSYGFSILCAADYARGEDPEPVLTIESYEMENPLAASGIYHDHRGRKLRDQGILLDVGAEGVRAPGVLYFYKGLYFFKVIYTGDPASEPDLKAVGLAIADKIPGQGHPPRGFEYLNVEGVNPQQSAVTPGYTFDYDFLPPAIFCDAPGAGKIAKVFLIGHFDEAEAERTAHDHRYFLERNGLDYAFKRMANRRFVWWGRDMKQGRVICTQHRTWVVGVLAPDTYEKAEVILDRIVAAMGGR
ncbi:MAG: DUF6599 family protein [Planctomycetota bacterium]